MQRKSFCLIGGFWGFCQVSVCGCGFTGDGRSFWFCDFFFVSFTFSCGSLFPVVTVTVGVIKDDVVGIWWVWQKLLPRTHLSKQLTSLEKEREEERGKKGEIWINFSPTSLAAFS